MAERGHDILVIGAGQAGLSAGYRLKTAKLKFGILDAGHRVGDSWRRRYDSLTLFTPRSFSQLPGLRLQGDPEGYPTRDEFAAYLEAYATTQSLPVYEASRVSRLTREPIGFRARLSDGSEVSASAIIVATGGFQVPVRPSLAEGFDQGVVQLDPETYRNASGLPPGTVLVVGDGASGRDMAWELAATHETLLAAGKPRKLFPERILGRSVWWWLKRLGLLEVPSGTALGRFMRRADPFPDRQRSLPVLQRAGVRVVPRLTAAAGTMVTFADGQQARIATVIWAVGYRDAFDWLDIPGSLGSAGEVLHTAGVSPVPGLFFVGRPWQRNRASALVMGVGEDARRIAGAAIRHCQRQGSG